MKAILEFDMNDEDDILAHMRCTLSTDMAIALWEIVHNTKKSVEYKVERALEEDKNMTPYDAIDFVYEKINEILDEKGIYIDSMIN